MVTNNFMQTGVTYSYNGSIKKTVSGGRVNMDYNPPSPALLKIVDDMRKGDVLLALSESQALTTAEPQWATPHIEAAFAYLDMGNIAAAKAELQAAKNLLPRGYEYEEEYLPHLQHLEEAISRHDPSQVVPQA
jgi:hypothetical protein